ncbi:MAG TPA: calcium-binding protein [Actinoplanes sp.]|nr:calcium-binding protein [Actinoplanes sp.]
MRITAVGTALLTAASALLWATPAQAATTGVVSVVQTTKVRYKAGNGQQNQVVITRSGNTITVDDRVTIKAGAGCRAVKGDKTRIRCTPSKAPTRVQVFAGDRNDRVENLSDLGISIDGGNGNNVLIGGPRADLIVAYNGTNKIYGRGGADDLRGGGGKDLIWGGAGADHILGDDGNDVISAGAGADYVSTGVGNDRVYGGAGNDHFNMWDYREYGSDNDYLAGGSGFDLVSYVTYETSIAADADGVTGDDGGKGERDTIATDVESIYGGSAADRLNGTARADSLWGYQGDDLIYGFGGDDVLQGEGGKDRLYGGAGSDFVSGVDGGDPAAKDLIDGGAGDDYCFVQGPDTRVSCER